MRLFQPDETDFFVLIPFSLFFLLPLQTNIDYYDSRREDIH